MPIGRTISRDRGTAAWRESPDVRAGGEPVSVKAGETIRVDAGPRRINFY
jgi:hypothetical protein